MSNTTQTKATPIANRVLLVSLTVTKPQLTKTDKRGTRAAEDALMAAGAGNFVKRLYPKHLIDPIVQVESEARAYVTSCTRMWLKGVYMLPSSRYMTFAKQMGDYQLKFNQSVTAFMNNITNVMTEAQTAQGAMFDASEYPDLSHLRDQFSFTPRYFPFAEQGDFALDMDDEDLEHLRLQAKEQAISMYAESTAELYERLFKAVSRVVSVTSAEKVRIHDSLMDSLTDLVEVLPELNITNDANLSSLIAEAKELIVDPNMLRASEDIVANVKEQAEDIMKRMAGFM